MRRFSLLFSILILLMGCNQAPVIIDSNDQFLYDDFQFMDEPVAELYELKRGDILVKSNHNWLYGTSFVAGGSGFGHAIIVVKGAKGKDAMDVLSQCEIFESQARDVPEEFQLRSAKGYLAGADYRWANTNFSEELKGNRYRLRLDLSEELKDSIINLIMAQDDDISCWRSQKLMKQDSLSKGDFVELVNKKKIWYCSLLIWQAVYALSGIDLDVNGGMIVYPNDLVSSYYFDGEIKGEKKRVRF